MLTVPAPVTPTPTTGLFRAATLPTPIGPLTIVADGQTIVSGGFTDDLPGLIARLPLEERAAPCETVGRLGPISDALEAYFAGKLGAMDTLLIRQRGGPFLQLVWEALRVIPPGQPTTYRNLAESLGGLRLARAVGMGCARNLIAPIVPCHRVTGSDGSLRGYYWGTDRKRWLLDHEARHAMR